MKRNNGIGNQCNNNEIMKNVWNSAIINGENQWGNGESRKRNGVILMA